MSIEHIPNTGEPEGNRDTLRNMRDALAEALRVNQGQVEVYAGLAEHHGTGGSEEPNRFARALASLEKKRAALEYACDVLDHVSDTPQADATIEELKGLIMDNLRETERQHGSVSSGVMRGVTRIGEHDLAEAFKDLHNVVERRLASNRAAQRSEQYIKKLGEGGS